MTSLAAVAPPPPGANQTVLQQPVGGSTGAADSVMRDLGAGATGPALQPFAAGFEAVARLPTPAQVARAGAPKPRADDLFELLPDPERVAPALFRTEGTLRRSPWAVSYIPAREGWANSRQAITDAMADADGRLLLAGRSGIGKTREAAEFAAEQAQRGWTIGLLRPDVDARVGLVASLPSSWHDARVLLVIDELQARVLSQDADEAQFAERLDNCLASIARQGVDELRVLVLTRDEPRFAQALRLTPSDTAWRGFGVQRLPELSDAALADWLVGLAADASLTLDATTAVARVADSDRRPKTLLMNVELGRVSAERWLPTLGESWSHKLRAVRARHPASDAVLKTIHRLAPLRVPARIDYVLALAPSVAEREAWTQALDGLVDAGVVGRRRDRLAAFAAGPAEVASGPEPTKSERTAATAPTAMPAEAGDAASRWAPVVAAITGIAQRPPRWLDDLTQLAGALNRADLPELATEVASLAIAEGADSEEIYALRGGAWLMLNRRDAALADLDLAITREASDANTRYLRGFLHYLAGDGDRVLEDLGKAAELGHPVPAVHGLRAVIHLQRQQWAEAAAMLDLALAGAGTPDPSASFMRGTARLQLGDLAGAESDFGAALETRSEVGAGFDLLQRLAEGAPLKPALEAAQQSSPDAVLLPLAHLLRGVLRAQQRRLAEAEADFGAAIELELDASIQRIAHAAQGDLGVLRNAREAIDRGRSMVGRGGLAQAWRGAARRDLGRFDEAQADFELAIALGANPLLVTEEQVKLLLMQSRFAEGEAACAALIGVDATAAAGHSMRGAALAGLGRFDEAQVELDLSIELGRDDAVVHLWRGHVRMHRGALADARQDLDTAVALGAPPQALLMRAGVRLDLNDASGAEADAEAALQAGVDRAACLALRGAARLAQGRSDVALTDLEAAAELGRLDPITRRWRGTARIQQGQTAAGLADLDAAIEGGDRSAPAYFLRGCVRLDTGDSEGAAADAQRALELGLEVASGQWLRGLARVRLQQVAEGAADLDAAIAAGRADPLALATRAHARVALGRPADAADDWARVCELQPDNSDAVVERAGLLADLGREREACELLDALLAHSSDHMQARMRRCFLHLSAGNFEASLDDLQVCAAALPNDALPIEHRAVLYYGLGRWREAVADIELRIAREGGSADVLSSQVEAHVLLGELDAAQRALDAMQPTAPEAGLAAEMQAWLALARGDAAAAVVGLRHAGELGRPAPFRLALAELLAGSPDAASADYRQALPETNGGNLRIALVEFDALTARFPHDGAAAQRIRADLAETLAAKRSLFGARAA